MSPRIAFSAPGVVNAAAHCRLLLAAEPEYPLAATRILRERVEPGKIDHDGLLCAARNHDHGGMGGVRILFPMRNEGWNEDVVAGRGGNTDFLDAIVEYELGVSASYEDRGFGVAVMMIVRHRRRRNSGLTHPDLLRTDRATGDRRESLHTRRLGG